MSLEHRVLTSSEHIKVTSYVQKYAFSVVCAKFSSVVSISTFSIKNANQFFYKKNIKNDYFPMLSKFEMLLCNNVEMILKQFLDVNWRGRSSQG
jgi:hypothetical protein